MLSEHAESMLHAVVAMGVLTFVMFLWMYATRIPAMQKAGIDPQQAMHPKSYKLPSEAARVADNYNHLFEAPTLFYAMVGVIVLLGHADATHAACAWAYVGFRVIHSIVQATFNRVVIRFSIFVLSWLALATMIIREAIAMI
ncbi:MAG: MAPEG family protein [Alphaproteobacteria bacterium]|nr:MAPEG family protein [Alphaproteobacteria bacterium]